MEKLTLSRVAEFSSGRLSASSSALAEVGGVSSDSRDIRQGDLFVALKGEQFNGHDYLKEAVARGAVAVLVETREMKTRKSPVPMVLVDDALNGLQSMARAYRSSLKVRTVAVAGSNGKTGTKEMVAAVLGTRFSVLKNKGNLNNHIGVPLSLMKLDRSHQVGVLEVGTNHPGELIPLLKMVKPLAGVITIIGEEHLEYFHDLEGVAKEEGTLAEVLPEDGLLALSADDPWSDSIARRCKARVVKFGFARGAEYRASAVCVSLSSTQFKLSTPRGKQDVTLNLMGRHQVSNALAAAAVGEFFGLDLEEIGRGLETVTSTKMRMESSTTRDGVVVINDAYNANPSSMRAALRTLKDLSTPGRRFAVLGEMRELGSVSESAHRDVGRRAAESGLDCLVVIGKAAQPIAAGARDSIHPPGQVEFFEEMGDARDFLRKRARKGDVVLLKASRGVTMEKVMEGWE